MKHMVTVCQLDRLHVLSEPEILNHLELKVTLFYFGSTFTYGATVSYEGFYRDTLLKNVIILVVTVPGWGDDCQENWGKQRGSERHRSMGIFPKTPETSDLHKGKYWCVFVFNGGIVPKKISKNWQSSWWFDFFLMFTPTGGCPF